MDQGGPHRSAAGTLAVRLAFPRRDAVGPHRGEGEVPDVPVVRVLGVDDVTAFLGAMVAVVGETPGLEVVGTPSSGEDALVEAANLFSHLVLLDVHPPAPRRRRPHPRGLRRPSSSPGATHAPLFHFVEGVGRWSLRVSAYAFLLITDRYPPFSLQDA